MATKSIYKNITVKNKRFGHALISALESAKKKKAKDVQLSRTFTEAKKNQIKDIFEGNK